MSTDLLPTPLAASVAAFAFLVLPVFTARFGLRSAVPMLICCPATAAGHDSFAGAALAAGRWSAGSLDAVPHAVAARSPTPGELETLPQVGMSHFRL